MSSCPSMILSILTISSPHPAVNGQNIDAVSQHTQACLTSHYISARIARMLNNTIIWHFSDSAPQSLGESRTPPLKIKLDVPGNIHRLHEALLSVFTLFTSHSIHSYDCCSPGNSLLSRMTPLLPTVTHHHSWLAMPARDLAHARVLPSRVPPGQDTSI